MYQFGSGLSEVCLNPRLGFEMVSFFVSTQPETF
jgi:hypothetical protein